MNGPDHYIAAENLLIQAAEHANPAADIDSAIADDIAQARLLARAQVHATLALAAATAHPAAPYSAWNGAYGS